MKNRLNNEVFLKNLSNEQISKQYFKLAIQTFFLI